MPARVTASNCFGWPSTPRYRAFRDANNSMSAITLAIRCGSPARCMTSTTRMRTLTGLSHSWTIWNRGRMVSLPSLGFGRTGRGPIEFGLPAHGSSSSVIRGTERARRGGRCPRWRSPGVIGCASCAERLLLYRHAQVSFRISPDELWKILSADDILARMDRALRSLVSLWPVVLGALVAGCLLAYAI